MVERGGEGVGGVVKDDEFCTCPPIGSVRLPTGELLNIMQLGHSNLDGSIVQCETCGKYRKGRAPKAKS